MRVRCPCCHAEYSIEQAVEDEAARELMGLLSDLPRETSRPLASYLGLWRAKSRALAWERALRIAREALELHGDTAALGAALSETVEAMRQKQDAGGWRPLQNHNYLKRVLESVEARPQAQRLTPAEPGAGQAMAPVSGASKTRQAVERLMSRGHRG
ncbi:hypothetical protein NYO91_07250 [Arhodomonas aquaeolei]|uniref:hypothetical protein n=1 Tax=Arhodomonas aquaeolei TaxID=2369 RepID=UPI0021686CEB|nr:hypothetical protein [Arhodomonas aquaeolei]MCS4503872.1 hypothetical protein [Arhodomonas aquaeolei]